MNTPYVLGSGPFALGVGFTTTAQNQRNLVLCIFIVIENRGSTVQ